MTVVAHPYWALCDRQFRAALSSILVPLEVYVIAVRVLYEEEDARRPYLSLSYNTELHFAGGGRPRDRDAGRRRWMIASYAAQRVAAIGTGAEDLRRDWLSSTGAWYSDAERAVDVDRAIECDIAIYDAFIDAAIGMVQAAHDSGFIMQVFGRAIPVLIFGESDDDPHLRWSLQANPGALAEQFREDFEDEYTEQ